MADIKAAVAQVLQARATKAQRATRGGEPLPELATSTCSRPVDMVWATAGAMLAADPTVSRRALHLACIERGVATNTARTQVQAVLKQVREAVAAQIAD